ncbi:30S ribosomal protein S14 [Tomitella biformata]|uniref:30S ribosomal protein S14 n=1 Tax=Tomitella biformata TaxID=630403 RepID=UPI000466B81E|nr:30S ribosomal protein S14 [Tomitella biformata]
MAKKSKIAANERRKALVARHAHRRTELRKAAKDLSTSIEERMAASRALSRLPRDSAAVRVRGRDSVDGRPRGLVGKFGLSRIRFREAAHRGELPGVRKSSW